MRTILFAVLLWLPLAGIVGLGLGLWIRRCGHRQADEVHEELCSPEQAP